MGDSGRVRHKCVVGDHQRLLLAICHKLGEISKHEAVIDFLILGCIVYMHLLHFEQSADATSPTAEIPVAGRIL